MSQEKQLVLILERSTSNLDIRKDGQDVILEGIFAQFGVVNNNDRIYEEKEYLPHLEYLQKKINERRLLGELDHPEKFDISLSKVSHVIEKLDYDKENRRITGRVRILDTPAGRIAKGLVESGVPISISSRAAGLVESNKHVKIKRIFTYDLVADPGFENAVLSRMNESLGILNENVAIYDAQTYASSYPDLMEMEEKETKTSRDMDYVTSEELNTYSLILKEEIEEIHKKLGEISRDSELSAKVTEMSESVEKMKKYIDYLANTIDESIVDREKLSEKLDKVVDYANYVANVLDESIEHTNQISEKTEKSIKYSEYLKEQIEKGIEYSEYLKECLEQGVAFSNYIAEKLDKSIQYSEHIAENANKGILYTEYVANEANQINEKLTEAIAYADYLGESLNNGISYTEYVAEQTQSLADYTEYMLNENKNVNTASPVNESVKSTDYTSLNDKIDSFIESLKESTKKQKVEEALNNLDEARKQKVSQALNESSQQQADRFVNSLLSTSQEEVLEEKWLTEAPENYKAIWESLEQGVKNTIVAQSKFYKLDTPYQIKNFWETRKLSSTGVLNENAEPEKPTTLGYTNSYLKAIEKNLERFGKKN